jgi:OmpA-OmpF porin, OOP family
MPFPTSASGNVKRYGAMANAMFDIDIGVAWLFPYLGVGAGYQWTNLHNVAAVSIAPAFSYATNDTQGAFTWQAIAGLSFPMPNMPGLSLTSEYRFLQVTGGEKFAGTVATAGGSVPAGIKLESRTITASCSAFAMHSTLLLQRRSHPLRRLLRHLHRRAPTWCFSIGTRRR